MKPDQVKSSLAVIMPLIFLVACGGGGPAVSSAPATGEANEANSTAENPGDNTTQKTISGRVADGYLQGAIVCIDINENGQCDPEEPQVESSAGGRYSLNLPDSAAGKPILAEVPTTAIDEDTNLPIGKEFVLSSPGDKPEFVSPITTLVHQELKNNPNLNTEDAAAAVLETLGLPDAEDASLFTDYVASSEDADEQRRDTYQFLHQTARVVASMMNEIHANVEASASAQGIDVDSQATAAAIRELVREEIRAQLPDISAAVAERILQIEDSAQSGSNEGVELTDNFDPDFIASNLGDRDLTTDIAEKIEAAKDEAPVERANMNELLAVGIYIIDVDCDRFDERDGDDGLVEPAVQQPSVLLNDEGVPEVVHMPAFCSAEYTHVISEAIVGTSAEGSVNDATSIDTVIPAAANLVVTNYYYGYDDTTGSDGWIMADRTREERAHLLTLVDGSWEPIQREGPYGVVEFTADGAAVMNTDEGKLLVYASSRDLSGKSVLHHILNRGADDALAKLVDESTRFPDESSAHRLNIKRHASLLVMFNWYPDADESGVDQCTEFGSNCNVVYVKGDAAYAPTPLTNLGDLVDGAIIDGITYDNSEHMPVDVTLHVKTIDTETRLTGDATSDITTITNDKPSGIATWTISRPPVSTESVTDVYPKIDGEDLPPEPYACKHELSFNADGTPVSFTDESGAAIPYCEPLVDHVTLVCIDANQERVAIMVPNDYLNNVADVKLIDQEQLTTAQAATIPDCPLPPADTSTDITLNDVVNPVGSSLGVIIGVSRWHTMSIQGIEMIAIEVPISVRHRMDEYEMAELLLIQDGKFVRRGARIGENTVDDETAYSGAAFDTLLPVVVKYITQESTDALH